jgi:hypothetical protein
MMTHTIFHVFAVINLKYYVLHKKKLGGVIMGNAQNAYFFLRAEDSSMRAMLQYILHFKSHTSGIVIDYSNKIKEDKGHWQAIFFLALLLLSSQFLLLAS